MRKDTDHVHNTRVALTPQDKLNSLGLGEIDINSIINSMRSDILLEESVGQAHTEV